MRIFSILILLTLLAMFRQKTQSPHGETFRESCSQCHSSRSWKFDSTIYSFDHSRTKMPLQGSHVNAGCRDCHRSLVFSEAKTECNQCHNDMHQNTTGLDCSRCHTSFSWLVSDITGIHNAGRFPLLGAHRLADCADCHKSESQLRFDVAGVNCTDCHQADYLATSNPNHAQSGFSTDCASCHPVNASGWTSAGFNHNFFPLTLGHSGISCTQCHKTNNYSDANPDCYSCHSNDYLAATSPNHTDSGFPTSCSNCHTTNPGWKPAKYTQHDNQFFPIYSGRHKGTWDSCAECHTDPGNYTSFNCKTCHSNVHRDHNYTNDQCYSCHPRGNED